MVLAERVGSRAAPKRVVLPVRGRANAPAMVAFFERHGAHVTEAPADYEERVKDGKLDVVVVIGDDFAEMFEGGRPAPLSLVLDSSRTKAHARAVLAP